MSTVPPYTITNESITVVWGGKPYTVQKGAPNFLALHSAITREDWDAVSKNLTVGKSLNDWAKGKITLSGEVFSYEGEPIPSDINRRILQMATQNESPEPIFNFWKRLKKNPSYRSVNQLFNFLQHEGIPLTDDGCFLAYKSVKYDYTDVHSGQFDNRPGTTNEMPRNKISDDPELACHEGFHVGALEYARNFHSGGRIVVCLVDPENVVCIPRDHSYQKMRVCKYVVIGNHNGESLPSTTFKEDESGVAPENEDEDLEELENELDEDLEDPDEDSDDAEDEEPEDKPEESKPEEGKISDLMAREADEGVKVVPEKRVPKKFAKINNLDMAGLMEQPIEDLRHYASKCLLITGASKIRGGKLTLVAKILEVRR